MLKTCKKPYNLPNSFEIPEDQFYIVKSLIIRQHANLIKHGFSDKIIIWLSKSKNQKHLRNQFIVGILLSHANCNNLL